MTVSVKCPSYTVALQNQKVTFCNWKTTTLHMAVQFEEPIPLKRSPNEFEEYTFSSSCFDIAHSEQWISSTAFPLDATFI